MRSKFFTVLFIIWVIVILTLTSIPKLQVPIADKIFNFDKLAHLAVYAILAFLFTKMNQHRSTKQNASSLIYLMLTIPLFDELHQIPIPGRTFSYYDILADMIGFLIIIIYHYKVSKKQSI